MIKIEIPYKKGDLVYALDYMVDDGNKYYSIVQATITTIMITTTSQEDIRIDILLSTEGKEWGESIPLSWISKDKKKLEKILLIELNKV